MWTNRYLTFLGPIILLFGGGPTTTAQAQAPSARDTVVRMTPAFFPTTLRVGVAINDLIRTVSNGQDTRYSGQADLVFGRFMLVGEYGIVETSQQNNPDRNVADFTYESQGSFFRAGVDVNLLKDRQTGRYDADDAIILFGLRYARARIDDRLEFQSVDPLWGTTTIVQQNEGLAAAWAEMTAGVKVEVFSNIFLGYNLRFKFARGFSDEPTLLPYYIPGFGRSDREEQFGFDYSIFYRIPLQRRGQRPIPIRSASEE